MSAPEPLAARIDAIEAHAAITDLVHAYARAVRHDRTEDVPPLFAPGGWFEIRDGHPSQGEAAVRTRFDSPEALGAFLLHGKGKPHPIPLIHNLMIELDGDSARASSVMDGDVFGTAHRVFGEYADTFVRIDGTWRFASRTFTIFAAPD